MAHDTEDPDAGDSRQAPAARPRPHDGGEGAGEAPCEGHCGGSLRQHVAARCADEGRREGVPLCTAGVERKKRRQGTDLRA